VEIEWEEALETIARRLGKIRDRDGAEAVAFAVTTPSGTPMVDSFEWVERFVRVFGSPNLVYAVEICGWHKDYAHALTFGRGIGVPDHDNADTIVLWGHNPARTWLAQATRVAHARRRGATIVVVDPKRGGSGEGADLWLPIHPGTDGALAMGAIHHLLGTSTFDHQFVRQWTNAPLLVDRESSRFVRASDLWPQGTHETFVVVSRNGQPQPFDPRQQVTESHLLLEADLKLRTRDGRLLDCATAFSLLKRECASYTFTRVSEITRLAISDIERFCHLFENSPRLAYHSWTGVGQHTNATMTERAIATLYALTGAVDRIGGNVWTVAPPARVVADYSLLDRAQQNKALGLDELPLGPPARGWITARDFCRAVLESKPYRVGALMSFGTNFAISQGGSSRNRRALQALDFHVHVDMFMNPTAENADIVLPASMPWEREALKVGFEITQEAVELIQLRQAMVPVLGECRADYEIVFDLACRLGHADAFFGGSVDAAWNHQLAPTGLTVADLRAVPEGIRVPQVAGERKYSKRADDGAVAGFATLTRRVEVYSELLASHGYPPLPDYVAPAGVSNAPADKLPLMMSTAKSAWYVHSSHRHVASLRRKAPDPGIEISPNTARERGIASGDWVSVQTAKGWARFRASLDPSLQDGVAIAEFGWWEDCPPLGRNGMPLTGMASSNINDALSDDDRDPVSGSVPLRAVACEITRDAVASRGWWDGERAFQITSARQEAEDVVALSMVPLDGGSLADFLPGQHVMVGTPAGHLARAYSLTGSCDGATTYDIAVKLIRESRASGSNGLMSSHIHGLGIGSVLNLRTPRGTFTPPLSGNRPIMLMAAGIGITPFVSYIDALAKTAAGHRPPGIHLIYVCRKRTEHPFGAQLRSVSRKIPELQITYIFTSPADSDHPVRDYDLAGRSSLLSASLPFEGQRPLTYICGPAGFIADATSRVLSAGVPAFDVFTEVFVSPAEIPPDLKPRKIVLKKSGSHYRWAPEAGTLLTAADAAGIHLPSGCRTGQCESCNVKVLSGTFTHVAPFDGPPDHCLTCRAVPLSDLVVDA
jgi:anaerobic selenocysteine-containing dehydrogenase/ferredoxin-NADP reductase